MDMLTSIVNGAVATVLLWLKDAVDSSVGRCESLFRPNAKINKVEPIQEEHTSQSAEDPADSSLVVSAIHAQVVQLLVELLLTGSGQLDAAYQPKGPAAQGLQPLAVLQQHLSHASNAHLAGPLLKWARSTSPAALLLLRLTCRSTACTLRLHLTIAALPLSCMTQLLLSSCATRQTCKQCLMQWPVGQVPARSISLRLNCRRADA